MIDRRSLLAGAAAAGAAAAGVAAADRAGAAGTQRLTIVLDWLLNPNHAALFAALQTGAFARAGLNVDIVTPPDPEAPCRLVAAGLTDLAVFYGSEINTTGPELPMLRIATLVDCPLATLVALGGGAVRSLADLKGRKIGVPVGGPDDVLLNVMLQSAALTIADVTVVRVSYNMVTALILHQVDAIIGAYRNAEVLQMEEMGLNPIVFLPEDHGVPVFDELILVAHRDKRDDPRFPPFVAALQEGTATVHGAPDIMWSAFIRANPDLDTPLIRASWKATLPHLPVSPGHLDAQRYLAFQQFALRHGMASSAQALDQFAIQLQS